MIWRMGSLSFLGVIFFSSTATLAPLTAGTSTDVAPDLRGNSKSQELGIEAGSLSQSSAQWRNPKTPSRARVGLSLGDQAGGPVRYNTRFPELKSDPNPASYYHAQAFVGLEAEYGLQSGALLIGGLSRRDLWHRSIAARSVVQNGEDWMVEDFDFSDQAFLIGWVFGERYREAAWSADFALVYDQAVIKASMSREVVPSTSNAKVSLSAASFRTRIHFSKVSSGPFQLSAGPELHLPVWSQLKDDSDINIRSWVGKSVDLKNSAAVGFGIMTSLRL